MFEKGPGPKKIIFSGRKLLEAGIRAKKIIRAGGAEDRYTTQDIPGDFIV
jgi:hypothetical protein